MAEAHIPPGMRYERYLIDPRLSWALEELHGTDLGGELLERVKALAAIPTRRPGGVALDDALAAHRAVLAIVRPGIRLTQAGYLPPAIVREIAPHLPTMDDWIHPYTREVDAHPIAMLRSHLAAAGLVRVSKGTLVLTAAGGRGLANSTALWNQLAARIVPTRREFDGMAAALILLHVATAPSRQPPTRRIAGLLSALGWSGPAGAPIDHFDVQWIWNDLWAALGCIGTPVSARTLQRIVGDDAVALMRDALLVASTE